MRNLIGLIVPLVLVAACGGSDEASSSPVVDQPTTALQSDSDPAPASDGDCPYLPTATLTTIMGQDATLTSGDDTGCQWSLADGSQGLLQRFPVADYERSLDSPSYLGDLDVGTGRWGNQNVIVLLDDSTLLYTDSLRGTPLREELQQIGAELTKN